MTLKAGRETAGFTFDAQHIGFEVDFYHPDGAALALCEPVVRLYEAEKERAEIFTQASSGTLFSSDEILSWFLLQTATTLGDHLVPKALEEVPASGTEVFVTFPLRFDEGAFVMDTAKGVVAMKTLKLMVRVKVEPK